MRLIARRKCAGSIEILHDQQTARFVSRLKKLSVDKALEKLRGGDDPKSRTTRLDEKK